MKRVDVIQEPILVLKITTKRPFQWFVFPVKLSEFSCIFAHGFVWHSKQEADKNVKTVYTSSVLFHVVCCKKRRELLPSRPIKNKQKQPYEQKTTTFFRLFWFYTSVIHKGSGGKKGGGGEGKEAKRCLFIAIVSTMTPKKGEFQR